MFFIGSTGPLLTLILSVILPLFFLTAKHYEKIYLYHESDKKTTIVNEYVDHSFSFTDIDNLTTDDKDINIKKQLLFEYYPIRIPSKYNFRGITQKPASFLNDSGNKAPPSFLL